MISERNILTALSGLIALLSLAAALYVLASGQCGDVDGLMLIAVALIIAGIFGGMVLYDLRPVLAGLQPAKAPAAAGPAVEEVYEHTGGGTKLYMTVWGALLGLTLLEVILAYQHLPLAMMLVMLMGLSVMKAALIMAYFMHLRFERLNLVLTLVPTLVVVICLMFMVFPDSFRILQLGLR